MLPHLNLKVDRFTVRDSFFQEILDWMLDEKNDIKTMRRPTGKALGHDINWRVIPKGEPGHCPGHLTFEFETEADKLLFILKKL